MKRVDADKHDAAAMTLVAEMRGRRASACSRIRPRRCTGIGSLPNDGDKNAQFALAMASLAGRWRPRTSPRRRPCSRRRRRRAMPGAWYNLGVMALEGNGVASDFARAAADFRRKAADLGFPDAAYSLGPALPRGTGRRKGPEAGRVWLLRRGARGLPRRAGRIWHHDVQWRGRHSGRRDRAAPNGCCAPPTSDNPLAPEPRRRACFSRDAACSRTGSRRRNGIFSRGPRACATRGSTAELEKLTPVERLKVQQALRAYLGK